MTIHEYLTENGYPEHVVKAGREGLLHSYREFVKQVEHGYKLGLEDYRNDLDARAILRLADVEDAEVHALDARLKKMLTGEKRVWESAPGDPFWDFGHPKNASGDLLADLKGEDLA
jgi:hypothetical protein